MANPSLLRFTKKNPSLLKDTEEILAAIDQLKEVLDLCKPHIECPKAVLQLEKHMNVSQAKAVLRKLGEQSLASRLEKLSKVVAGQRGGHPPDACLSKDVQSCLSRAGHATTGKPSQGYTHSASTDDCSGVECCATLASQESDKSVEPDLSVHPLSAKYDVTVVENGTIGAVPQRCHKSATADVRERNPMKDMRVKAKARAKKQQEALRKLREMPSEANIAPHHLERMESGKSYAPPDKTASCWEQHHAVLAQAEEVVVGGFKVFVRNTFLDDDAPRMPELTRSRTAPAGGACQDHSSDDDSDEAADAVAADASPTAADGSHEAVPPMGALYRICTGDGYEDCNSWNWGTSVDPNAPTAPPSPSAPGPMWAPMPQTAGFMLDPVKHMPCGYLPCGYLPCGFVGMQGVQVMPQGDQVIPVAPARWPAGSRL